jgi:hypothetical protein
MTIKRNVTGLGVAAQTASAIVGGVNTATAGAGTTRTDASLLPLVSNHWVTTAANNSGVILPPGNGTGDNMQAGDYMRIYNDSSNTLLLYPPTGGQLNGGTVSTGTVSIPTKTTVEAVSLNGLAFLVSGPTT